MRYTLHKDDTVSVRMTLDELDHMASATFYGYQKWNDIYRQSAHPVDKRIAENFYNTHIAAGDIVAAVRRRRRSR